MQQKNQMQTEQRKHRTGTMRGFLLWCMMSIAVLSLSAQNVRISGTIVDGKGEGIIGANILVKGTNKAVITDMDGKFSMDVPSKATLQVSYVGYKTALIQIEGKKVLKIILEEDSGKLNEVVVVGYGTQKKESLTGSVTSVGAKAFTEKGSLSSPLQALQGQTPGVFITRGSSAPGDESWAMTLRGAGSIRSTDPLIIIDGVAYNSVNDLRLINPNDIESISFLKDGSAAIYGSRAAGGVMLITTKKGSQGKVKVEYGGTATVRSVGLMPKLMNIDQWADGVMQTLENDGNTSNVWYTYAQLAKKYKGSYIDLTKSPNPFGTAAFTDVRDFVFDDNVNWLGSVFGNTWSTEQNLSISGGAERSSYRVSMSYLYDGSTLQYGNNNNQRYNIRSNNTYKLSDALSIESSISYNRQEQVSPTNIASVLTVSVPMPGLPLKTLNGKPYAWGTWGSPVSKVELGGDNKLSVSAFSISETLKMKLTSWLDANTNLGYNTSNATRNTVSNSIDYYNYTGTERTLTDPIQANTSYTQTAAITDFYSVSGYLNAHKKINQLHNLSLTLGSQYEFKQYTYFGVKALNIQEGLEIVNGSGEVKLSGSEDKYQNANLSYFGRFNYDYNSRYLVEINGRYDGSSKFEAANRWDLFYGGSLGWRLSEEAFLKDVDVLSNLKLRASYAEMGNQSGISNYDGVQLYNLNTGTGAYVGADRLSYIAASGTLPSSTRSWERIKNYNLGLDFGLFNNTLTGSLEMYEKKNDNMLVSITFPAVLGASAPTANAGKFKTWGYEGQINYSGKAGKVSYNIGGTFSFSRNELVDYGGVSVLSSGYRSTQQGYPLASIFGLRYAGKIQTQEQLDAYKKKFYENNKIGMPANLRIGDNMFADLNGDKVLDQNDYEFLGSDTPEVSYSCNAGIAYSGFDLNVIFQGAANRSIYRAIDNWTVPFRANYTNTTTASIGRTWNADNRDAYYSPYTNDANINNYNYQASSLTAQDGSYIRLKNITLGYTVPAVLLKRQKYFQSLRVYITGTDLWEYTKIKDGWDPEAARDASGTKRYPFTRNLTFGVNATF